jgi:serine protease AprX
MIQKVAQGESRMIRRHKVQIIIHCEEYDKRRHSIENLGQIKYRLPMINSYVMEVDEQLLDVIKSMKGLLSYELDTHITAQMKRVNDVIESNWAHEHGYFGTGVGVAVVDTGVALHKDFVEGGKRVIAFVDFINHRSEPYDDNGHGTHVSGFRRKWLFLQSKYMECTECNIIGSKVSDKREMAYPEFWPDCNGSVIIVRNTI